MREVEEQNRELLMTIAKREEALHQANVSGKLCSQTAFSVGVWVRNPEMGGGGGGGGIKKEYGHLGYILIIFRFQIGQN